MKKLLLAIITVFALSTASFAQTPASTTQTTHTKKDGTADKRYKENKTAKTTVHTKKDGTADKRYKENKPSKKKS